MFCSDTINVHVMFCQPVSMMHVMLCLHVMFRRYTVRYDVMLLNNMLCSVGLTNYMALD